ncbi:MAG: hypothetical protein K8R21_00615 [Leptospira sp.]|nr:hypothetical protein [Leptospira sp.]
MNTETPIVKTENLNSYKQTVSKVFEFAERYKADLEFLKNMTIFEFYNLVRALPYHPDPKGEETVVRQKYTIQPEWKGARDCDDKTLLILSFANLKNIPGQAVVCGQGERPHHIYPEIELNGKIFPADATYPRCSFSKKLYNEKFRKVFKP